MGKPTSSRNASSAGLEGGFAVNDRRHRRLDQRARVLGFDELPAYLQTRCDASYSVPRIAAELGVGDWQVQAALAHSGCGWRPAAAAGIAAAAHAHAKAGSAPIASSRQGSAGAHQDQLRP